MRARGNANRFGMLSGMETRLTDLEVRYTYLERTVRELDQVVIGLRSQVERLQRELSDLRTTMEGAPEGNPANEKPPHY